MGLQTWPLSEPSLPSMACLEVETPSICRGKFKSVLQLCLQQRRSREQLVDQGIMPPLKTPAAFHEKIRNLERARTGNFLKHKLCSRPERSELVRMHILQETQAEPSLQATQMKLKRARLADDLNEKIAKRPGPLELVEKKILPVDSTVEELIDDVYSFDEDSSDPSSPLQSSGQHLAGPLPSPSQSAGTENTSISNIASQHTLTSSRQCTANVASPVSGRLSGQLPRQSFTTGDPAPTLEHTTVKQTMVKPLAEKVRSKKGKDPKPRVKKLKYHQYIPPDQKQENSELQMDSCYARILQQQQQFLQLQILSQQQQQQQCGRLQSTSEAQTSCPAVALGGGTQPAPAQAHCAGTNPRPDHLPPNLDEMKVAELKAELKLRSLPVSGTKTDLVERLKLFHENLSIQSAVGTEASQPVSLIASKVSSLGIEDDHLKEGVNSPQGEPGGEKDCDKDKRLHEKERQIEELMRKLEQEQKLVEELKMQLEVEKRSQQTESPLQLSPVLPIRIKEEHRTLSSPSGSCGSPGLPALVKQEEYVDFVPTTGANHFTSCHGITTQPEDQNSVQTKAHMLMVELSSEPGEQCSAHGVQRSGPMPQQTRALAALDPPQAAPTQPLQNSPSPRSPLIPQQPRFANRVSKSKDPPRYEDAVKQTRGLLTAQGSSAASQHMDDLFDVLFESGEIPPFIRQQDPPGLDKPLPVTASVTTLPINTVLSRPPPLVQVAQPPGLALDSNACLAVLTPNNHLGALLEDSLIAEVETQKLDLIGDLNLQGIGGLSPSSTDLHAGGIDNMDWLDLTLSTPAEGDIVMPGSVFTPEFLDSHELQMSWD